MNVNNTMRVWIHGQETERPIARVETQIRLRFGGCEETLQIPVPQLHPGERLVKRQYKVHIVPA